VLGPVPEPGGEEAEEEIDLTTSLLGDLDADLPGVEAAAPASAFVPAPAPAAPAPATPSPAPSPAAVDSPFASREEDLLSEAAVFLKYGLHRKAAERLEEVLELNPLNFDAHRRLVSVHLENGDDAQALQAVRIALAASRQQDDDSAWQGIQEALGVAGYRFEGGQLVAEATVSRPALQIPELAKALSSVTTEPVVESPPAAVQPAPPDLEEWGRADIRVAPPQPSPAVAAEDIVPPAALEFPDEEPAFADAELLDASAPTTSSWLTGPESQANRELFEEERQFLDLAAEIRADVAEELEPLPKTPPQEQTLEEIVEGFRRGVSENISEEDADTHYNLGIAYREMNLLDEAIGEFQISAKDPRLRVDSCSMLGFCFLEKGQPELAVKWYQKALETEGLADQQRLGLLYDLGSAYESMDDRDAAYRTFLEVCGLDDGYRDVVDKVQQLQPT
jgi:tetratricopeptide (TPR) repeat protein